MKVLWVCNVPLPQIARDMRLPVPNINGWLAGFANALEKRQDVELHVCFPVLGLKELASGSVGRIHYYAFSQPRAMGFLPAEDQRHASKRMIAHIKAIVQRVQPELLHLFGSEYIHSLIAAKTFGKPERTVVNIQGLTSVCFQHFSVGIPHREMTRFTISNLARGSLLRQQQHFRERGAFERELLSYTGHVIGRTDWDFACTEQINPGVKYHFCNESLRDDFYTGCWDYEKCEKHSIFVSQSATTIKGLHLLLKAMPEIVRVYPDAHVYVAGNNPTKNETLYQKLKISAFGKYLLRLIRENGLEKHITFTGQLTGAQLKERMLRSNVFVSPSTIENESNSISEAKLLALPVVASYVGGVTNRIQHGVDGYFYQQDAPYMLSHFVKKVFAQGAAAAQMGLEAQRAARVVNDREKNLTRLLEIYGEICGGQTNE